MQIARTVAVMTGARQMAMRYGDGRHRSFVLDRKIRFLRGREKIESPPYQSIEVSAAGKEEDLSGTNGPKTTVNWKGSSLWWLAGDTCGIIIALCFLGEYLVDGWSCAKCVGAFVVCTVY